MLKKRTQESGQVLLIVILVLIVALTVGLSTVSRSITNLRLAEEEISSKKALAAAEAGIEKALLGNVPVAGSFSNSTATYSTTVSEVLGTTFLLAGGNLIPKDEGATLWLSDYSEDIAKLYGNPWSGQLVLSWGDSRKEKDCDNAALEIITLEGPKTSPKTTRYAYDPCSSRRGQNHFSSPSSGGPEGKSFSVIEGRTLLYKTEPIEVNSGLMIRVIPLYANTYVGVDGGDDEGDKAFPSQGFLITSLGQAGTTKRKIKVFKEYPQLPAGFFSHSLFSP